MVIKMMNYFNEIEFFPILNIILQLNALVFFTMFMIGFTIKKLLHIVKG